MKDFPRTPITGKDRVSPEWLRWFADLKTAVDEIRIEPYIVHTGDVTFDVTDLGKVHIFNIGTGDAVCTMPSVDDTDLFKWLRVVRIATTGTLSIYAADSDRIEYGSPGNRIWCNETKRKAANLTLQYISDAQWAITGATGFWYVA